MRCGDGDGWWRCEMDGGDERGTREAPNHFLFILLLLNTK